jgi:hypothetical protein
MEISEKTGVQFGIMEHPGGAVSDDAGLKRFIDPLKPYPVYRGLQPMSPGWSKSFSPEAIKQLDYVLMDPQTNGNGYGETLRIWNFDTYVDDLAKSTVSSSATKITGGPPLEIDAACASTWRPPSDPAQASSTPIDGKWTSAMR